MSDDRFNVIVHHSGEVEAREEAAEVEIGDASGLNSDVEVEDEIEVDILFQIINLPHSSFSSTPPFEKVAAHIIRTTTL
ncbi:hypothetical protein DEO72_LG2g368 [Vigna unguiculata]|uniref:Uncharacterized protein n=1 Tax=Vigna unguiculata TaxID=3917 RepID=A0A4D6KX76_VIGUN|nr:hypothetical protein DEO72_LG2g368 [Vigna unguiculata]